jgi:hypothetical protein
VYIQAETAQHTIHHLILRPQDNELGRKWVDQAADAGLDIAVRMRDAGYDPDEVTPDADNWKYAPLF